MRLGDEDQVQINDPVTDQLTLWRHQAIDEPREGDVWMLGEEHALQVLAAHDDMVTTIDTYERKWRHISQEEFKSLLNALEYGQGSITYLGSLPGLPYKWFKEILKTEYLNTDMPDFLKGM